MVHIPELAAGFPLQHETWRHWNLTSSMSSLRFRHQSYNTIFYSITQLLLLESQHKWDRHPIPSRLARWGQRPWKSFKGAKPRRGTKCCPTMPRSGEPSEKPLPREETHTQYQLWPMRFQRHTTNKYKTIEIVMITVTRVIICHNNKNQ